MKEFWERVRVTLISRLAMSKNHDVKHILANVGRVLLQPKEKGCNVFRGLCVCVSVCLCL